MKLKLNKSFIFSLIIVGLVGYSVQAQTITNSKDKIPVKMNPGTIVKYDQNNNLVIVQNGYNNIKLKDNSNQVITNSKNSIFLPLHQPGMTVSYDGKGEPSIIKDRNGVPLADSKNLMAVFRYTRGYYSASGNFTWYTDNIGQGDHVLGAYDCATKMYVDNPPLGTTIYASDISGESGNRSMQLQKWDVGSLPNAVLDIRPEAFQSGFGHSLDEGLFRGSYYHY